MIVWLDSFQSLAVQVLNGGWVEGDKSLKANAIVDLIHYYIITVQ